MNNPMRGHQAWLEAPYQRMAVEGEAFEAAAERYGLDPDEDHDEIVARMEDEAEAGQEAVAEARAEARAEDRMEGRDEW